MGATFSDQRKMRLRGKAKIEPASTTNDTSFACMPVNKGTKTLTIETGFDGDNGPKTMIHNLWTGPSNKRNYYPDLFQLYDNGDV